MDRLFNRMHEQEREANERLIERLYNRGREHYDRLRSALRSRGRLGVNGMFGERQNQSGRHNCEQDYRKNGLHHLPPNCDRKPQINSDGCCQDNGVAAQRLNLRNAVAKRQPGVHTCMLV